jgi:aminoglycoside phosphotransferase (APT) family kinase protein
VADDRILEQYLAVLGDGDASPARLAHGQFHDVVLRGDVAYRFPRDEESRRLLPGRAEILRVLRDCPLPAAIPGLLSADALDQPLGRCHIALQRVPGEPSDGPGQPAMAADLARLLDRCAELGRSPAVRAAVPQADQHAWRQFADQVAAVLYPLMSDAGRARARDQLDRVLAVDPTGQALVHGDLGGGNLLWTAAGPERRLAGVLDWDDAHTGSQADDLASIAATFGWPFAAQVDAHRHGGQTPTIAEAQTITATFALQQALPAALSGDIESLDDGLINYR